MTVSRRQFLVAKPERAVRLERVQVLVVNSSEKAGKLIKSLFQQLGFTHVVVAHSAAEAVFMMRQVRVDMVLVDAQLYTTKQEHSVEPEWESLNGIEFVRRLRHAITSPNRFAPAIVLSDTFTEQDIRRARDAGVNELLMKPLSAKDFCERVTQIFDKPRNFVTAQDYKGPCRRRRAVAPEDGTERRTREVRVIRNDELRNVQWNLM